MNKLLPLEFFDEWFEIKAGSYYNAPEDYYTVFIDGSERYEGDITIKDVYDREELLDAIKRVIVQLYKGKKVFVGCSSGIHNTGIFLIIFTAIMMQINPEMYEAYNGDAVVYVTENFHSPISFDSYDYLTYMDYSYVSQVVEFLHTYPIMRHFSENVILWLFR